jgi:tryptophan synthase alpha chain
MRDAGADAIEVGIPFSDPVMDGGVIQEASAAALAAGAHPSDILATIAKAGLDIPVAVMTYVNPVYRHGFDAFLTEAREAGVAAAIVPDLPVDEAEAWIARAAAHGLETVFLAAPGTSPPRLAAIAAASRGFVYCVATYGARARRAPAAADRYAPARRRRHRHARPGRRRMRVRRRGDRRQRARRPPGRGGPRGRPGSRPCLP